MFQIKFSGQGGGSTIDPTTGELTLKPKFTGIPNVTLRTVITSLTDITLKGSNTAGTDIYFRSWDADFTVRGSVGYPVWEVKTYAVGDKIWQDNEVYKCNTAGAQSTDFTTNSALWTVNDNILVGSLKVGASNTIDDNNRARITIGTGGTGITSPDGNVHVYAYNDGVRIYDGPLRPDTANTVDIGTSTVQFKDLYMLGDIKTDTSLAINDGNMNKYTHDSSYTRMYNPANTGYVLIGNTFSRIRLASTDRLNIDATSSLIDSPDGNSYLRIKDGELLFRDGERVRDRFSINSSDCWWKSPDGSRQIYTNDLGSFIDGGTAITSDRKLKDNIVPLDIQAINFINDLNPVSFTWKMHTSDGVSMGFIAQDVESVAYTDSIVKTSNDTKYLDYTEIIAPLVKYVQELEKRITTLENR